MCIRDRYTTVTNLALWLQHLNKLTYADRQGVDISFTVCLFVSLFVCIVVRLRMFSGEDKAIAASNFARWFNDVLGREFSILDFGELCSFRSPKSDESAIHQEVKFSVGMATVIDSAGNACDRHVWITSVPEDARTCCLVCRSMEFSRCFARNYQYKPTRKNTVPCHTMH